MNLIGRIERDFPSGSPPVEPLVEAEFPNPDAQGDEGATAYFSGQPWNALQVRELRYHSDAMYMFTPAVHNYYLPAFMRAALQAPKEAGEIPDKIIWHLAAHEEDFWWQRIRLLNVAQCEVVAEFVCEVADVGHGDHKDRALAGLERARRGV